MVFYLPPRARACNLNAHYPDYLLGGLPTMRTEPVSVSFFLYDPWSTQDSDVIEDPFDEGVSFSVDEDTLYI